MSDQQTVPIIDPSGQAWDIPYEKMHDALAAGGKPGVLMQDPSGKKWVIPADKTQDAVKAGGQLLPFEEQPAQHPGFWHAVASNIAALPGVISNAVSLGSTPVPGHAGFDPLPAENAAALAQADTARKAIGEGLPERAGSAIATMAGTNVPGMERSAAEGDVGGVLGHAVSGMAMAAAPLLAEGAVAAAGSGPVRTAAGVTADIGRGAAKLADVATFERVSKAASAIKQTAREVARRFPEQEAATIPATTKDASAAAAPPSESLSAAAASKPTAQVYRDATLNKRNIPDYAGEEIPDKELPKATSAIVDQVVPPTGKTIGANLYAKAQIEAKLQAGDAEGAQAVLDQATGKSSFPPESPRIVPATQNIRENEALASSAEAQPRRYGSADAMEDRALGQEMNWNLERHGYRAESEARREFIARNSTGVTKGGLTQQAADTPDLMDLLNKSLEEAQKRKRPQAGQQ